jgi:hypothetical protein
MITNQDIINDMIEVTPIGGDDGFKKVKETLTRMGIANRDEKILNQSCHILHRRGQYYICHFKELIALDGLRTDLSDSDIARRNRIAQMLEDWNLVEIHDKRQLEPMGKPSMVMVIKHSEKDEWYLKPKYTIGIKKGQRNDRSTTTA